jgi:hypothetical protein
MTKMNFKIQREFFFFEKCLVLFIWYLWGTLHLVIINNNNNKYISTKKRIADSVKPGMCVGGIGCILVPCHPIRAHEWSNYVETWNVRD